MAPNQVYKIVQKIARPGKFFPAGYNHFRANSTKTLLYFFKVNQMYGKLFLGSLLIFGPINLTLSMWLVEGKLEFGTKLILYFWSFYLFIFLFLAHFILAYCAKHINRPRKHLLHIVATNNGTTTGSKRLKSQVRLRISLHIWALSTKHHYGFTYGTFGLVSMRAFTKVKLDIPVVPLQCRVYMHKPESNLNAICPLSI